MPEDGQSPPLRRPSRSSLTHAELLALVPSVSEEYEDGPESESFGSDDD